MGRYQKEIPKGSGNWYWYDQWYENGEHKYRYIGPVNPKRKKRSLARELITMLGGPEHPITLFEMPDPGAVAEDKALQAMEDEARWQKIEPLVNLAASIFSQLSSASPQASASHEPSSEQGSSLPSEPDHHSEPAGGETSEPQGEGQSLDGDVSE